MSSIGGTYQKSLPAGFFTPSGACGKRTPSTACLLLPLPTGRSPSLDEGGMGTGKSKVGRMSAGARRVIGATAKPLYPIDGKAAGFDRRNPKTSLFEGGGPPAAVEGVRGRWKESAAVEGVHHALPKIQLLHFICFICFSCLVCPKHMMFLFKNHQVSFRRMSRSSACFFSSNQRILKSESA